MAELGARLLRINGSCQIICSTVLGLGMLLPMQSWFPWKVSGKAGKNLLAVHLDWYMLGFMQFSAASLLLHDVPKLNEENPVFITAAKLMIFGGWMNPSAYFFRALGINAFELGGGPVQVACASLGMVSVLSIVGAWALIMKECNLPFSMTRS